jgi:hypothetical protein
MSDQVPTTFVTTFENNMRLAMNQHKSLWFDVLPERTGTGSELKQLDDVIGQVMSRKGSDDGRHGDVQYANTGHSRVWVAKPDFHYYAELVDNDDQVQAAINLTSGYMQTGVATINRGKDDEAIAGFFGSMITGKSGQTTTPFPSGNVIGADVGGVATVATGLNIAKLRAARRKRAENFVDMSRRAKMIVTADDTDQLLNEMPVTSREFGAEGGELRDGKLRALMGFDFIEMETANPLFHNAGLVDAGSGNRKTPWWEDGMLVRVPWYMKTTIDRMPGKHGSTQVYASLCAAVTRTDDAAVGYILNKRN